MEANAFEQLDKLFDELVPMSGKAESLAGELVRAASRIGYRFFNDGDMVGVAYGKETCNPAARFILKHGDAHVKALAQALWEVHTEDAYEAVLGAFIPAVANYVNQTPSLRELPAEDMYDCRNPYEDFDDSDLYDCEHDEYDDYMDEAGLMEL